MRNEKAENFLALLKEWAKLVDEYNVRNEHMVDTSGDLESDSDDDDDNTKLPKGVFEVAKLLNICYGDPHNIGTVGLKFLVFNYLCIFYALLAALWIADFCFSRLHCNLISRGSFSDIRILQIFS